MILSPESPQFIYMQSPAKTSANKGPRIRRRRDDRQTPDAEAFESAATTTAPAAAI